MVYCVYLWRYVVFSEEQRLRFKEWIKQHYRIILIGLVLAAVIFAAVFVAIRLSGKKTEITQNGAFPVRINEILTSNGSYPNGDGLCCGGPWC